MVDTEKKEEQPNQQILSINFNQDGTCFAIGTQKGFRIYNTYPFKENIERRMTVSVYIRIGRRNWNSGDAIQNKHNSFSRRRL
jgi:hypothetical protein